MNTSWLTPCHEMSVNRNFTVYYELWFSSSSTDLPGEQAYNFDIFSELDYLIHLPICFPDAPYFKSHSNTNPSAYNVRLYIPLASSDYSIIYVFCLIVPALPVDPPNKRCFWYHALAGREDLWMFFTDSLCNSFQVMGLSVCVARASHKWLLVGWKHAFRTFSLLLKLKSHTLSNSHISPETSQIYSPTLKKNFIKGKCQNFAYFNSFRFLSPNQ